MNHSFFAASFALAFAAVGCAAPSDGSDSAGQAEETSKDPNAPAPAAGAPHIESVTALGTGCRSADSYTAKISDDGNSVLVEKSSHELSVARGEGLAVADCQIAIRVADAGGHAFTLESFETTGYASLHGADMKADETVNAYIQGNPAVANTRVKSFVGVLPGARYTFADTLGEKEAVWSPCDGGRDLNVGDRVVLRNNADKSGFGYVGSWTIKLALKWRSC